MFLVKNKNSIYPNSITAHIYECTSMQSEQVNPSRDYAREEAKRSTPAAASSASKYYVTIQSLSQWTSNWQWRRASGERCNEKLRSDHHHHHEEAASFRAELAAVQSPLSCNVSSSHKRDSDRLDRNTAWLLVGRSLARSLAQSRMQIYLFSF